MDRVLRIAPSTWLEHARRKADPELRSTRAKVNERLSAEILRVHRKKFGVYGARKVWLQLNREGFKVGRDRVARLIVENSSGRLRQQATLMPEHLRSKAAISPPTVVPPPRPRRRPPKTGTPPRQPDRPNWGLLLRRFWASSTDIDTERAHLLSARRPLSATVARRGRHPPPLWGPNGTPFGSRRRG
ncbi:IS3 family transposase [Phreatobacter sp.]|uniref:IS3 family transposase n=1 Tax=Phreatobacter sp. TaxID=1966341 RepID=UPI003459085B